MSLDPPTPPESNAPVSLAELRSIAAFNGSVRALPAQVNQLAELGRQTCAKGELDFCIGVLAEQIESLREGVRFAGMLMEDQDASVKDKINLLDKRGRLSSSIVLAVGEMRETAKVNGERRVRERNKARSFAPDQIVVPVQVNVNAAMPPEKPAAENHE